MQLPKTDIVSRISDIGYRIPRHAWWYLLVLAAVAWRTIYAYWTPLVNKYVVPPGDDPAFHVAKISDLLAGHWQILANGYPLGWHLMTAVIAKLFSWDALTAVRLIGPLLLVLPVPILIFVGARLFNRLSAGIFAAVIWTFLALAPIRAYGDGNYPNLLAGSVLVPLALLALALLSQRSTWHRLILLSVSFGSIALVHHLSLIYVLCGAIPLFLWWSVKTLRTPHVPRARLVLAGSVVILAALAAVSWPYYKPLLLPFIEILRSQGSLAATFGSISAPITWGKLLEVHNPLLVALGLAGLFLVLISPLHKSVKILFAGWVGLLWLLSATSIFGLPERFVRELAIPLSLTAGFFLAYFIERPSSLLGKTALFALAMGLLVLDWQQSFNRPFALPDPYKPLIRVQHEEEFALATLRSVSSPSTTILTNNSNPYLPYLVDARVLIAISPTDVDNKVASERVDLLFIGSRPPLVQEDIYPFYAGFEAITQRMLAIPGKELVEKLPSGTEIYRVKTK